MIYNTLTKQLYYSKIYPRLFTDNRIQTVQDNAIIQAEIVTFSHHHQVLKFRTLNARDDCNDSSGKGNFEKQENHVTA